MHDTILRHFDDVLQGRVRQEKTAPIQPNNMVISLPKLCGLGFLGCTEQIGFFKFGGKITEQNPEPLTDSTAFY